MSQKIIKPTRNYGVNPNSEWARDTSMLCYFDTKDCNKCAFDKDEKEDAEVSRSFRIRRMVKFIMIGNK
jgi:hypothetical protein